MKEIKRRRQFVNIYYQCDVCKKEYYSVLEATNCEKSHTCEHEPELGFQVCLRPSLLLAKAIVRFTNGEVMLEDLGVKEKQ